MFMRPQVIFDVFVRIEDEHEVTIVPADVLGLTDERFDDDEITPELRDLIQKELGIELDDEATVEVLGDGEDRRVYGWRLSAPGYMDCTDWNVCSDLKEVRQELMEQHDIHWCEHCEDWVDRPFNEDDVEDGDDFHGWNNHLNRMECYVDQ